MDRIAIGIPILNRLDLLQRCLAAIDLPADLWIVNNSIDPVFRTGLENLAEEHLAFVLHQERNRGVAGSWNLLARTAFENGHEWLFIGSNDTFLAPGSLAAAVDLLKADDIAVWHLCAWNFFLINRRTIETVGWFDENFYPAYKEDQDYSYRCQLAGVRRIDVPGASAEHVGSATIKSNPDYAAKNRETHCNWNQNHYLMKWGGDAGSEQFRTPYNREEYDFRWWPDPAGSIELRDWDNVTKIEGQACSKYDTPQ